KALQGTTQNDILKEYLSRGTYVFPPAPSMRLTKDVVVFTTRELPRWNPINVCSYHLQEAGATPVQELAIALAIAIAVLDRVKARARARRAAAGVERGARPAAAVRPAMVAAHAADPRLRDRPAGIWRHLRRLGRSRKDRRAAQARRPCGACPDRRDGRRRDGG